jgi:hypothetical protein
MIDPSSPGPVLAIVLLAALGAGSCTGEDFIEERQQPQPGPGRFDAGAGVDAELTLCPASPPKVGERCPSSEETQLRCTFPIDVCEWQGSSYDITVDYCCQRGVVWDSCGTNTTPCDRELDAGPSPPAADAGADGTSSPGADAGGDGTSAPAAVEL